MADLVSGYTAATREAAGAIDRGSDFGEDAADAMAEVRA